MQMQWIFFSVSLCPDTVPDVIHDAAQRPNGRRRSSIVDNSAEKSSGVGDKLSAAAGNVYFTRPALKHS
jgi:hypothetical protein